MIRVDAFVWRWGAILFGALALVNAGAVALYAHKLHTEQGAHAATSLELSNTRARADTTRLVYHDSLTRIVERLSVQTRPAAVRVGTVSLQPIAVDSLRAVIRTLEARRVASVDTVVSVPAEQGSAAARSAVFDVRQTPYTARATVSLPSSGRGTIDLTVSLDTIPLTVRPSCGPADANGIRPAVVAVSGPPWATVALARVEQDPDLCRSPALERAGEVNAARRDRRLRLALVLGYGYTFPAPAPRAFVGAALALPIPLPRWLPLH